LLVALNTPNDPLHCHRNKQNTERDLLARGGARGNTCASECSHLLVYWAAPTTTLLQHLLAVLLAPRAPGHTLNLGLFFYICVSVNTRSGARYGLSRHVPLCSTWRRSERQRAHNACSAVSCRAQDAPSSWNALLSRRLPARHLIAPREAPRPRRRWPPSPWALQRVGPAPEPVAAAPVARPECASAEAVSVLLVTLRVVKAQPRFRVEEIESEICSLRAKRLLFNLRLFDFF